MYYTLEKTAEILEMNPGDVNRLREQGKLRAFRDGAAWKFRKEDVEKFLTDMIRARSASASSDYDLLSNENDEEGPTMLADSAAFDSMLKEDGKNVFVSQTSSAPTADDDENFKIVADGGADEVGIKIPDEAADVAIADDDLKVADAGLNIVDEDDDFKLAADDDDFELTDESSSLTDEHSALVDDEPDPRVTPSSVDLAGDPMGSDDDLLHLGSGSGLALLDEPDVAGAEISLENDVVLGGSAGSSGSGLSLSGEGGLALLGESDGDFQLDDKVSDEIKAASEALEDEPDIFELAEDDAPKDNILSLAKSAEADAPTELVDIEDSIFDLADGTGAALEKTSDDSDSESASQLIATEANPFLTDVDSSQLQDDGPFELQGSSSTGDDVFAMADEPAAPSDPFGLVDSSPLDAAPAGFGAAATGAAGGFGGGFGAAPIGAIEFGSSSSSTSAEIDLPESMHDFGSAPAPASTNFTGKDMIILVPCLLLLVLASISAWELCRTIWSYQEGVFDFGGPILETLAKMVKLI